MTDLIRNVDSCDDIASAAAELRRIVDTTSITPNLTIDVLEAWGSALGASDTADLPGVPFLRLWLRRNTLEPIITKELGEGRSTAIGSRTAAPGSRLIPSASSATGPPATSRSSRFCP